MLLTKKNKEMLMNEIGGNVMHAVYELMQSYQDTLTTLASNISNLQNERDELQQQIEANTQKLFEAALEADRKKRYDSPEPFVEIVSQTFSEEGGVQLRLDWNKPFIDYLKKNGFTGPSEESIVDNWLISLSRERIAEGGSEYK